MSAVDPGSSAYWDAVGAEWADGARDALWRHHSDAVNGALLRDMLPARMGSVLKTDLFDEAVGEGLHPLLAQRAARVVGIDVSAAAVAAARARHPDLEARVADARALPFGDGEFGAVVSTSTLDHYPDPADLPIALAELTRVLAPGGTLIVTLDNLANPLVALRNRLPFGLVSRLGLVPYYVGATTGPRGLRRMLGDCGLEVRELGATLHCPRAPAVWAARLVDRRGGPAGRERYLRAARAFELLERAPTRFLTGHMVRARAVKP